MKAMLFGWDFWVWPATWPENLTNVINSNVNVPQGPAWGITRDVTKAGSVLSSSWICIDHWGFLLSMKRSEVIPQEAALCMKVTVQTSGNCNPMKNDFKAGFLPIMSEHLTGKVWCMPSIFVTRSALKLNVLKSQHNSLWVLVLLFNKKKKKFSLYTQNIIVCLWQFYLLNLIMVIIKIVKVTKVEFKILLIFFLWKHAYL